MKARRIWLAGLAAAFITLVTAAPARAEPVSATIAVVTAIVQGASFAAIAFRLAVTVGISLLSQALNKPKTAATDGAKTTTTSGGTTPQTFIVGKYLTAGQETCPPMTYGVDGKTPNAYLVYVIALGCIPGQQLSRIVVSDNYVTIGEAQEMIGGSTVMGYPLLDDYAGNAWVRYHDGTQTEADALLMQKCATYPDRPWSADMVGVGQCYAIVVFKLNKELYSGFPPVRFEMAGVPLYDPRHDDTVGGSGDQRWETPSTWATTTNNMVINYNVHRGIALPDGMSWGGEAEAGDLPLDNWFAAMNACDVAIDLDDETTEPMYQGGLEISLSDQPADILEAMETASCAQSVEIGGIWKVRVGGPGLPVMFFTDDDILIDHDQGHDMFPGLDETHNGIQATHPLPSALWEMTDAPALYNAAWEAQDGGRRLVADLPVTACSSPTQVQRIMTASINDERRLRRHPLTMGPYADILEPLDSAAWTSAREGYTAKIFEVAQAQNGLFDLNATLALRERDSTDFVPPAVYLPWVAAIPGSRLPVAQEVPGFTVTGTTIKDGNGSDRRAALAIEWDPEDLPDVTGVMYEVRVLPSLADVASSSTQNVDAGGIVIAEGIVGSTDYQARARLVADRRTNWTSWVTATTPDVRLATEDLPEDMVNLINSTANDLYKLFLSVETYKQITQALLYTGDGQSVQFVSLQALNKSETALERVDLIGVLAPDSSAYILNTDFVRIDAGTTLAGYVSSVGNTLGGLTDGVSDLGESLGVTNGNVSTLAGTISEVTTTVGALSSSVTDLSLSIDGVRALKFVKVQAGMYAAGFYANADDTTGTSQFGVFASQFLVGDTSDPDHPLQVFLYSAGLFTLNGNLRLNGAAVIEDSLTIHGVAINTAIVPAYAETVSVYHGNGSTIYTLCSTTVTLAVAGTIEATACVLQGFPSGDDQWDCWLYVDGVTSLTAYAQGAWTQVSVSLFNVQQELPAGTYTVQIKWKGGSTIENVVGSLFAKGIQKVA